MYREYIGINMVAGIDAINSYNFFMKPVNGVDGIGSNGCSHGARRVEGGELTGGGYNPFATISRIDCELHPDVGVTGSHSTNGVPGYAKHTFNILG